MKRILILGLCIIPFLGNTQARGAIEIYVNGHRYGSLAEYLASKKTVLAQASSTPVSLNAQEQKDMQQEAQQLGVKVDFTKVKTIQVNQKDLSDSTRHRLYVMGVENGMVDALKDFYQNWGQSDIQVPRSISPEQLQEAIQQAIAISKGPKLLISTPGKVRIMSMATQDTSK